MIRVLVVDPHPSRYEDLRAALEQQGDIAVVGSCWKANQVLRTVQRTTPDVVLMSLFMPRERGAEEPSACGLQATREVVAAAPGSRVVLYHGAVSPEIEQAAEVAGAVGFLLTPVAVDLLVRGVRDVARGGTAWVEPVYVRARVAEPAPAYVWA